MSRASVLCSCLCTRSCFFIRCPAHLFALRLALGATYNNNLGLVAELSWWLVVQSHAQTVTGSETPYSVKLWKNEVFLNLFLKFDILLLWRRKYCRTTLHNRSDVLCAYKSYVRLILVYGTTIFSPKYMREIARLESVPNSLTRKLLVRVHRHDYNTILSPPRNRFFNLPTLECRRRRYDSITIYRMINGFTRTTLSQKFYTFSSSNLSIKLPIPKSNIRF